MILAAEGLLAIVTKITIAPVEAAHSIPQSICSKIRTARLPRRDACGKLRLLQTNEMRPETLNLLHMGRAVARLWLLATKLLDPRATLRLYRRRIWIAEHIITH